MPKGSKDTRHIKNNRPIMLLSTDYKILARILAKRLKMVLPDIVGPEQSGFMETRSIQDNIRKTMDVVAHIYQSNKKAVIVSIDFLKCFDKIEHRAIYAALRYYNFGETFINWIKVFFTDFAFCTQNAGYVSNIQPKGRGVNQGCPISPFLFNIIGAIMAQAIQSNPYIKGVKMNSEVEHIISQFADDTVLFLMYEESCITNAISELMRIESNTGLQISYEKTYIYRIGSLRGSNAKFVTQKELNWSDGDIELLGVTIKNQQIQDNLQINKTITKMSNIANVWKHHSLTLIGKILVINSLMCSSLYVYRMGVLPPFSPTQIKEIEKIITKFLWNDKKAKIPLKVLYMDKKDGGQKLTNVKNRQKAMLLKWVPKVCEESQWSYVHEQLEPNIGKLIWKCNIAPIDVKLICSKNTFWQEILQVWSEVNFRIPQSKEEVVKMVLWHNLLIRVNNIPLKVNKLIYKKIQYVGDLLDENEQFMEYSEMCNKYQLRPRTDLWLWFQGITQAIPKEWKRYVREAKVSLEKAMYTVDELVKMKKVSCKLYEFFRDREAKGVIDTYEIRWYEQINSNEVRINKSFKDLYKITDNVKLRNFQYRLLLGKIFSNDILYKWKIVESPNYDRCRLSIKQSTRHLLYECKETQKTWDFVKNLFETQSREVEWTMDKILRNNVHAKPNHIMNLIVLITKQYIHKQKCLELPLSNAEISYEFKTFYEIEKYNHGNSIKTTQNGNQCWM